MNNFKKANQQTPQFTFSAENYKTPDEVFTYYAWDTWKNRNYSEEDINELFEDTPAPDEALITKVLKAGTEKCAIRKAQVYLKQYRRKTFKITPFIPENKEFLKKSGINFNIKK